MRHRPVRFLRGLAGDRQGPRDLLRRKLAAAPGPRQVAEHLGDGLAQRRRFLDAFDDRQPREGPPPPPGADAVPLAPELLGDPFVPEAFERQQDDLGPVGQLLRAGARKGHRLQRRLLTFGDDHLGRHPWHDIPSDGAILRPEEKTTEWALGWKPDSAGVI